MTSYQSRSHIRQELQKMLPHQLEECKECDRLPLALEELIKHNYDASYVCYDHKKNMIEVGVEDQEEVDSYPQITVHKFPLEEVAARLHKTFRTSDVDLMFYGRLLAGGGQRKVDEVVLV